MKRLQFFIEPEQDEALAMEAARTGSSKAAIIRRLVAQPTAGSDQADPVDALIGGFEGDPGDIDDVVHAR